MLCSTESMHAALVSSTGAAVQRARPEAGRSAAGFAGGTMPAACASPGTTASDNREGSDTGRDSERGTCQ